MNSRLQNGRPRPPEGRGEVNREKRWKDTEKEKRARPTPNEMELVLFEKGWNGKRRQWRVKTIFMAQIITQADNLIKSQHSTVALHTQQTPRHF